MKKVLFLALMMAVVSCGSKFGDGGDNAAQYIREQMPELTMDAVSVEAVDVKDCYIIDFDSYHAIKADEHVPYFKIDRMNNQIWASLESLKGEQTALDKAKQIGLTDKRKVYTVIITAKSGKKYDAYVIMEKDEITPYMTFNEYMENTETIM